MSDKMFISPTNSVVCDWRTHVQNRTIYHWNSDRSANKAILSTDQTQCDQTTTKPGRQTSLYFIFNPSHIHSIRLRGTGGRSSYISRSALRIARGILIVPFKNKTKKQ